jgi:polyhydroxyalkanoate synthase
VTPAAADDPLGLAARYWATAAALARATEADTAIGATPADAVFTRDKTTLRRYRPLGPPVDAPPLLIVHGLVGRAAMTDLDPRRSLVRDLLGRGFDLWTLDWGAPGRADRETAIDDVLEDHLAACVARIAAEGRTPALLGVCEGGVFSACFAALWPDRVAGAALAVTPIDFHADPDALLPRWARAFAPEALAGLVDAFGYLPGGLMGAIFEALTPARTIAKYTGDLMALEGDAERTAAFLRMETWLADRPHHPGAAAKQLLVDLYHDNALARGAFRLCGRTVDLGAIRAPVLTLYGLHDHIVTPPQARAVGPLLKAARHDEVALDAGHIGVFVSARARDAMVEALAGWLLSL